jgi:hypothetical protein
MKNTLSEGVEDLPRLYHRKTITRKQNGKMAIVLIQFRIERRPFPLGTRAPSPAPPQFNATFLGLTNFRAARSMRRGARAPVFGRHLLQQTKPMSLVRSSHRIDLREAGWHSRGYLPHFDGRAIPQFVTLRLFDSVPNAVLQRWMRELDFTHSKSARITLQTRIERYLEPGLWRSLHEDSPRGRDGAERTPRLRR